MNESTLANVALEPAAAPLQFTQTRAIPVSHALVAEATIIGATPDSDRVVIAWGDRLGETGRMVVDRDSLSPRVVRLRL